MDIGIVSNVSNSTEAIKGVEKMQTLWKIHNENLSAARVLETQSLENKDISPITGIEGAPSFSDVLDGALKTVSEAQSTSRDMAKRFAAGDESVDLQDVMINLQLASLSFQQMTQVRNKLVSAYQDIMNMPV